MKTMTSFSFARMAAALALAAPIAAQPPEIDLNRQQEAIRALSFMVGEWHGEATFSRGPQAHTIQMVETITPRLDDTLLLIEGLGSEARADGTMTKSHEAIALVWFDEAEDRYRMRTFIAGRTTEADFELTEEGLAWGFDTPSGGRVQYTATFEGDTWTEEGQFSPDGETWMSFLTMTLARVDG